MAQPVPISFAAYERSGFPTAIALNCFPEKSPTSQRNPLAMIARPGLEAFKLVGDGPIRGILNKAGLFGGDTLIVSGQALYRLSAAGVVTQLTGVVEGDDLVDWDAGQDADLLSVGKIATGDKLYHFTETLVTEDSTFNDGGGASSVCYHRGFWLASATGTDQVFHQVPGDTTWDALSYMSAEYAADPVLFVRSVGDKIIMGGGTTTQGWTLSGSDTAPFIVPYGGLEFDFGCLSRASAVNIAGTLIWVDNNGSVRLFDGGEPRVISDNGLAEQLRNTNPSDVRAGWFLKDQHACYVLSLTGSATWGYDLATGYWVKFASQEYPYWRTQLFAAGPGGVCYAADAISEQIYRLNPDLRTDAGETFPVRFSAFEEGQPGFTPVANLQLECEVGASPREGQGSEPLIRMRRSDDRGKNWTRWFDRPLGATGKYDTTVKWNGLGQFGSKGRIYEFQVSDPVGRRFYGLMRNA